MPWYIHYNQEIRQLGWKVYDFDVPNELTVNRLLYKDPYHAGKEVKEKVVLDVWEDK